MDKLEQRILETVDNSISQAITKEISGFDSPMRAIAKKVVDENSVKIKDLLSSALDSFLSSKEFKKEVDNVMMKKFAQQMLSNTSAEISSVVDKIQAKNPVLKQEIEVAIAKIIKSYE